MRRIDEAAGFREEIVLRVANTDEVQKKQITDVLTKAIRKLLKERNR